VDIYDTSTNSWSTTNLSQARSRISATSAGGKVFFGGGVSKEDFVPLTLTLSSVVDIYDTSTNSWSTTNLSQARYSLAATSADGKVFFGGGYSKLDSNGQILSSVVDIYTIQTYGTITSSKTFALLDQTTVAGRMQLNGGMLSLGTFDLVAGSLSGSVPIDLGSGMLSTGGDNSSSTTYSGVIRGGGTFVKTGTGTLILSASNTYAGTTSVTGGTLLLAAVNSLSPGSPISVTGGSVLDLGGLSQTTSSTITLQSGTLQNGTLIANGGAFNFQTGIVSANLAGSAGLTKSGSGTLTLSGSNSYSGGTVVSQGTLNVSGSALPNGGNVQLAVGTTLSGSGIVRGNITGLPGSTILASGDLSLGDSTSFTGFSHAGTLDVGSNSVTLGSKQFTNLGVLTTLSGGTINALKGISLGVGCALSGSGAVNGKIAAGYGSTINATGNLTLGDSTSPAGFASNGELYTNANTVTLYSMNQAVLGSLTQIGDGGNSGTLVAAKGIVLNYGNSLVGQGTISTPNTLAAASIINGNVDGTGSGLTFTGYIKGEGSFNGRFTINGTLDLNAVDANVSSLTGSGIVTHSGTGSHTLSIDSGNFAGTIRNTGGTLALLKTGSGQLILSGSNTYMGGTTVDDGTLYVTNSNALPTETRLTIGAGGTLIFDPSAFFASPMILSVASRFSSPTMETVPEPGTLSLLGVSIIGLLGWAWRKRVAGK